VDRQTEVNDMSSLRAGSPPDEIDLRESMTRPALGVEPAARRATRAVDQHTPIRPKPA
jgi:hypothetical protein